MTSKLVIIICGLLLCSCGNNTKSKVIDIHLEEVKNEEPRPEPPPPPPPGSSRMTFREIFQSWITDIIENERPSESLIAYNFGIFESDKGYIMYLVGSNTYDKNDDGWTAGFGDYTPKDRYLKLPGDEFKNLDSEGVQEKIEKTIKEFLKTEAFKNSFLNKAKAITTGFDDGDLVRLK
jgi:hypothetical protein